MYTAPERVWATDPFGSAASFVHYDGVAPLTVSS